MNKIKTAKTKLGNEIYLTGDENAKVLVIGVFHGDEPQGKYLIEKYLTDPSLAPHIECKNYERGKMPQYFRGCKLFIPCLNPDGLQLGQRTNANGVDIKLDFNRKKRVLWR